MTFLLSLLVFLVVFETLLLAMNFRKLREAEIEKVRASVLMESYKDNFFKMANENSKNSRAKETLIKC